MHQIITKLNSTKATYGNHIRHQPDPSQLHHRLHMHLLREQQTNCIH